MLSTFLPSGSFPTCPSAFSYKRELFTRGAWRNNRLCGTSRHCALSFQLNGYARTPNGRQIPFSRITNLESAETFKESVLPKQKTYDVLSIGNLCVDIVMPVESLPPPDTAVRLDLLQKLSSSPPDVSTWEVGGACNFMIAAARLGMKVGCVGQLGDDVYGTFLRDVLREEGIPVVEPVLPAELQLDQTLLCFVLVSPSPSHAFCSRYDFGPWPLVSGHTSVPHTVMQMLEDTQAVYLNGFVFDELEPQLVVDIIRRAKAAGAAIFFDPGPRCWTLMEGERHQALLAVLKLTDVVLMTEDEAVAVTGCSSPVDAAQCVLTLPGTQSEWCVVKLGADGAMLCTTTLCVPYKAHALKVDVKDTVGCGDSFAAAVVLGYVSNHSIPTVMALANAVGAATAMGTGAGRNVASVDVVHDLLTSSIDEAPDATACVHSQALRVLQDSVKIQRKHSNNGTAVDCIGWKNEDLAT